MGAARAVSLRDVLVVDCVRPLPGNFHCDRIVEGNGTAFQFRLDVCRNGKHLPVVEAWAPLTQERTLIAGRAGDACPDSVPGYLRQR